MTLYFSNEELRSCWPVKNVNGQPTTEQVVSKSDPFRNQHNHSLDVTTKDGSTVNGKLTLPGTALKAASVSLSALTGGTTAQTATTLVLTSPQLVNSDEVAGAELRQSDLTATHWKVPVTAAVSGDPTYVMISIKQFPDGYSNRSPSWWVDPSP